MTNVWGAKPLPPSKPGAVDADCGFGPPGTQIVLEVMLRYFAAEKGLIGNEGAVECWIDQSLPQLLNCLLKIAVESRVEAPLRSGAVHMITACIRYGDESNSPWMKLPRDVRFFVLKQLYNEVGQKFLFGVHEPESSTPDQVTVGELASHAANAVAAIACAEHEAGQPAVLMSLCPERSGSRGGRPPPTVFAMRALSWVVANADRSADVPSDHLQVHITDRLLEGAKAVPAAGMPDADKATVHNALAVQCASAPGLAHALRVYPSVIAAPLLRNQVRDAIGHLAASKNEEVALAGLDAMLAFVGAAYENIGDGITSWARITFAAVGTRKAEMAEAATDVWELIAQRESGDHTDDDAHVCAYIERIVGKLDELLVLALSPESAWTAVHNHRGLMEMRLSSVGALLMTLSAVVGPAALVEPMGDFIAQQLLFENVYHQETAVFAFGWLMGLPGLHDGVLRPLVSQVHPMLKEFVAPSSPPKSAALRSRFSTSRWALQRLLDHHEGALLDPRRKKKKKAPAAEGRGRPLRRKVSRKGRRGRAAGRKRAAMSKYVAASSSVPNLPGLPGVGRRLSRTAVEPHDYSDF